MSENAKENTISNRICAKNDIELMGLIQSDLFSLGVKLHNGRIDALGKWGRREDGKAFEAATELLETAVQKIFELHNDLAIGVKHEQ